MESVLSLVVSINHKRIQNWHTFTILRETSNLDAWQCSEYASVKTFQESVAFHKNPTIWNQKLGFMWKKQSLADLLQNRCS